MCNAMFSAAKKEAESLAELVEAGGEIRAKVETVADACREYAASRPEAEARFKRYASYGYSFSAYSARTFGLMLFRDWNF